MTAEPERDKPAASEMPLTSGATPPSSEDKWAEFLSQIIGMTVTVAFIASFFAPVRSLFFEHWKIIVSGAIAVALVVSSWRPLRSRMRQSVRTKVGAIVASLAALLIIVVLVGILPTPYQILALRSILVLTACLFPSVLYYLFITTRKDSLCSEFFTNLERLGLLVRGRAHSTERGTDLPETEDGFRLRLLTYVQKFEAAYGPLDQGLVDDILDRAHDDPRTAFVSPTTPGQSRRSAAIFSPEAAAPLVICTTLIALGWIISLPPWQQQFSLLTAVGAAPDPARMSWAWALYPDASPVYYAFIGAYFFGIQMLFRRYVLKDLRTSAYVSLSLRILLAIIGVWVLIPAAAALGAEIRNDDSRMLVVAFAIGVFPPVIWQFIQAVFKKLTFASVFLPSLESQMPLSELDGLTIWHEARLQEEDIENIPNMATTSLVDLMLNTRFSPDRIVDWVDQAILYTHLGPEADEAKPSEQRRAKLRAHGIRGASTLVATYEWSEHTDRDAFEKILPPLERSTVRTLVQAVVTNPNLAMILAWRQLAPRSTETARDVGYFASLGILPATMAPPR